MDSLHGLAAALQAPPVSRDAVFTRVVTDTRQLATGDLFVALSGEKFDAHQFLAEARARGAVGALVSRPVDDALPQVLVPDTLIALQTYAAHWRRTLGLPVVGVTGSNGKTTTKQMLAAVFAARGPVLATVGNLNNHIGVPLTLLSLRRTHRTAVIEMGANHAGEIDLLTRLAQPQIGVVTQAGDAHLEGFGSREGVARAKGELFAGLAEGGIAVINHDDVYCPLWRELAAGRSIITFGLTERADVHALNIASSPTGSAFDLNTPSGRTEVELPLPGRHNVANALGAAACAIALGMDVEDIARGLASVQNAGGRLAWKTTPQGARLLDDSYNANPTSLRAGLDLLASLPGRRIAILGGMAELGPDSAALHREAGAYAKHIGIQHCYTLGPRAAEAATGFGSGAQAFDDVQTLADAARAQLDNNTVVLVKGSRSAGMERVVAALTGHTTGETH